MQVPLAFTSGHHRITILEKYNKTGLRFCFIMCYNYRDESKHVHKT